MEKAKSVRELGGDYYTREYEIVFTPLTQKEGQEFQRRVISRETRLGRFLTMEELLEIAERMEKDYFE